MIEKNRQEGELDTVIIFSHQMERLAQFYQDGLGIGPFEHGDRHMGCQHGALYFGIDQAEVPQPAEAGGVSLWFRVDDLQAAYDRLLALGASPRYPPQEKPWGDWLASVYDPDGNILGLSQQRSDAVDD